MVFDRFDASFIFAIIGLTFLILDAIENRRIRKELEANTKKLEEATKVLEDNERLRDCLQAMVEGLEWNIENHPTVMNSSDDEMLAEAKKVLTLSHLNNELRSL